MSERASQIAMAHLQTMTINDNDQRTAITPSFILPSEIWLHILEVDSTSPTHLAHLWGSVRLVSCTFSAYVERIFTTIYLPTLSLSLSLPRRDPDTGVLLYADAVPDAEVTLHGAYVDGAIVSIATSPMTRTGITMEYLTNKAVLSKERLDNATSVWMWFGGARNRGKGGKVKMPINVEWDRQDKVWRCHVEWKKLLSSRFWESGRH